MRRLAIATYAINFAQMTNMALTAFAVPLLIGAESYGLYAAIFALPGFLQSTLEAFAILTLTKCLADRTFWKTFSGLAVVAITASGLLYFVIFGVQEALWAVLLAFALLFRAALSAMVYTHSTLPFVRVNVVAELLNLVVYAVVLCGAIITGNRGFYLPIMMIAGASVISGGYMAWKLIRAGSDKSEKKSSLRDSPMGSDGWRFLWARSYEDLTLTLMPLFLAMVFGLRIAGEFRVVVSFMKVASKFFPLRYEVILRGIKSSEFSPSTFLKISFVFIAIGTAMALFLFYLRGLAFLDSDSDLWIVALSTGFLVTALAAFPVATLYSGAAVKVSTVLAFCTFAAIFANNFRLFLFFFIATHCATYLMVVATLLGKVEERPKIEGVA